MLLVASFYFFRCRSDPVGAAYVIDKKRQLIVARKVKKVMGGLALASLSHHTHHFDKPPSLNQPKTNQRNNADHQREAVPLWKEGGGKGRRGRDRRRRRGKACALDLGRTRHIEQSSLTLPALHAQVGTAPEITESGMGTTTTRTTETEMETGRTGLAERERERERAAAVSNRSL